MAAIACDADFLIKIANDPLPKLDWPTLSRQNEFCTLPSVVRELSNLRSNRQNKTMRRAVMALEITSKGTNGRVSILSDRHPGNHKWTDPSMQADSALLEFVREDPKSRMVATLDGELLSELEKQGLPYFTLSNDRPLIVSRRAMHLSRKGDL